MSILAERALAGLGSGEHACCTVGSEPGAWAALAGGFARDAFAHGHRVLYVADDTPPEEVRGWLADAGVDVAAREAAGWIEVRDSASLYDDTTFDPDATVAGFAAERAAAVHEGFGGLSVLAEMTWALRAMSDPAQLLEYERKVEVNFAGGRLRGVCAYDPARFGADLLREVCELHEPRFAIDGDSASASRSGVTVEHGPGDRVRLAGELDLASAPFARRRIEAFLGDEGDVVVDLGDLDYLDVTGGRQLLELAASLREQRRALRLEGARREVAHVLDLCGCR